MGAAAAAAAAYKLPYTGIKEVVHAGRASGDGVRLCAPPGEADRGTPSHPPPPLPPRPPPHDVPHAERLSEMMGVVDADGMVEKASSSCILDGAYDASAMSMPSLPPAATSSHSSLSSVKVDMAIATGSERVRLCPFPAHALRACLGTALPAAPPPLPAPPQSDAEAKVRLPGGGKDWL